MTGNRKTCRTDPASGMVLLPLEAALRDPNTIVCNGQARTSCSKKSTVLTIDSFSCGVGFVAKSGSPGHVTMFISIFSPPFLILVTVWPGAEFVDTEEEIARVRPAIDPLR